MQLGGCHENVLVLRVVMYINFVVHIFSVTIMRYPYKLCIRTQYTIDR